MNEILRKLGNLIFSNSKRKRDEEDSGNKVNSLLQTKIKETEFIKQENALFSSKMKRKKLFYDEHDAEICPRCTSEKLSKRYNHLYTSCKKYSTLSKLYNKKKFVSDVIKEEEHDNSLLINEEKEEVIYNDPPKGELIEEILPVKTIDFSNIEEERIKLNSLKGPKVYETFYLSPPEREINELILPKEKVINHRIYSEKQNNITNECSEDNILVKKPKKPNIKKKERKMSCYKMEIGDKVDGIFNLVDDEEVGYNTIRVTKIYEPIPKSEIEMKYKQLTDFVDNKNNKRNFPLITKEVFENSLGYIFLFIFIGLSKIP